ncbi:MAG: hypothetical protein HQK98_11855 [Nitrospirae bacterium]|nr:hypothetical protein [Nitrospirota bacterium]
MKRVGNVFTGYISSDGTSWSACSTTYTRSNFNSSVAVGIIAWNPTAIDYFNEATPSVTATPIQPKLNDGKEWRRGGPDNIMMYKNPDGIFTDVNGRKRNMNGMPV